MRLGVIIDERGLTRLNPLGLVDELSDQSTVVCIVRGVKADELLTLIQAHELEGLVIASSDDKSRSIGEEALQKGGADRFALRVVNLADFRTRVHPDSYATSMALRLLTAAMAMVREQGECRQANIRMSIGQRHGRFSRRSLLTLPMLHYELVPAVDDSRCFASSDCDLCVTACPAQAVAIEGGVASIQKERCLDCGLCIAACPSLAIDQPVYRRQVLDAGLTGLMSRSCDFDEQLIVAFACPAANEALSEADSRRLAYPAQIVPFEVPRAAFVDAYLVLRAFDLGAAGVAVVSCGGASHSGCSAREVQEHLAGITEFLELAGVGERRLAIVAEDAAPPMVARLSAFVGSIAVMPVHALMQGPPVSVQTHHFELAALLAALWRRLELPDDSSIDGAGLSLGQVSLEGDKCSMCGLCAGSCPAGALLYEETAEATRLLNLPGHCAACGICVALCPEGAIHIERDLQLASLEGDPRELKTSRVIRCRACGSAFAGEAMLTLVLQRLPQPSSVLLDYCPDCRLTARTAPAGANAS